MGPTTFIYLTVALMFVLPGAISLWVGISGSKWFFESSTSRYISKKLGFTWARVLYSLLGLLLIAAAILIIIDPLNVMEGIK